MSDEKLRALESRWRKTGAVEDEAAYLLERVRVGDLTLERLELAAYCGHEGARRAVGGERVSSDEDWVLGLARWGRNAVLLASAAVVRASAETMPAGSEREHCERIVREVQLSAESGRCETLELQQRIGEDFMALGRLRQALQGPTPPASTAAKELSCMAGCSEADAVEAAQRAVQLLSGMIRAEADSARFRTIMSDELLRCFQS